MHEPGFLVSLLEEAKKIASVILNENHYVWNTLNVDYEHPYVHRLFCKYDKLDMLKDMQSYKYNIYLHKIFPAPQNSVLYHPHPWMSAMEILEGKYEMGVAYGKNNHSKTSDISTLVLGTGTQYEMLCSDGWHYVKPLEYKPVYTIMITADKFENPVENEAWSHNKKPLGELTYGQKLEMINKFKELLS